MHNGYDENSDFARTEHYVRTRFRDMSSAAFNMYFSGLRLLERNLTKKPFVAFDATEEDWQEYSHLSIPTIRRTLPLLHRLGVIEFRAGSNGRDGHGRKKGRVRRRSIDEMKRHVTAAILERFVPADADELGQRLQMHGVPWHDKVIYPRWSVAITGRLSPCGSTPMTARRTNTKGARLKAFRAALQSGEVLLECDVRSAEPTLLIHDLERSGLLAPGKSAEDVYALLQTLPIIQGRDHAKREFQRHLAYTSRQRIVVPPGWGLPEDHFLRSLAAAVDQHRETLWCDGRPSKGSARHVYTLAGRKVSAARGRKIHRGRVLSWRIQGTVADIMLKVVSRILDDETKGLCRFFMFAHDAVFVAITKGSRYDPGAIIRHEADRLGIKWAVRTQTHLSEREGKGEGREGTPQEDGRGAGRGERNCLNGTKMSPGDEAINCPVRSGFTVEAGMPLADREYA